MRKKLYVYIIAALALLCCRKDIDHTPPVVHIGFPVVGTTYRPGDTVFVSGSVSDESGSVSISIDLVNENYVPVTPVEVGRLNGAGFSGGIIITDSSLSTGTYIIRATASDGTNKSSDFQRIKIQELERVVLGFFALTRDGSFTTTLNKQQFNPSTLTTFSSQAVQGGFLAIDQRNQQVGFAGKEGGSFNSYSTREGIVKWSVPSPAPAGNPSFHHLSFQEGMFFLSRNDYGVSSFNSDGKVVFSAFPQSGYNVYSTARAGNVLFVHEKSPGKVLERFSTYYISSGSLAAFTDMDADTVILLRKSEEEVFALVSSNGQGRLWVLQSPFPSPGFQRDLAPAAIIDADTIAEGQLLILQETGLYKYSYSSNSFIQLSDRTGTAVDFDPVSREIFLATGNEVVVLDENAINVTNKYIFQAPVMDVQIWYNK